MPIILLISVYNKIITFFLHIFTGLTMTYRNGTIGLGVALFLLGCSAQQPTGRELGALTGGALGAGLGAIVGNQTGHAGQGVAIGAAAGALSGALIGNATDNADRGYSDQEERLRRQEEEIRRQRRELEELKKQQDY